MSNTQVKYRDVSTNDIEAVVAARQEELARLEERIKDVMAQRDVWVVQMKCKVGASETARRLKAAGVGGMSKRNIDQICRGH